MEQRYSSRVHHPLVDRLKSEGDVAGLSQFFLDQTASGSSASRLLTGSAATAIAELGTAESDEALFRLFESTPDAQGVADEVGKSPDPGAVKFLVRMARHHQRPAVRQVAARTLARNFDWYADRDEVFDGLLSVLDDPEWSVRAEVALQLLVLLRLGRLREDPRVVELLTRALADPHARVREAAADGLRYVSDPRAAEALRAVVADPDERVRGIAEGTPGVLEGVLEPEVRALADERAWPRLRLKGNPVSSLMAGAVAGLIIGIGVLAVLTRGDFEGILVLLGGGGGGLGLIIVAVTVVGGAIWGFVNARLGEVPAGSAAWDRFLAVANVNELKAAKARLARHA